jgi:predicted XRE-type DNA-binding protein
MKSKTNKDIREAISNAKVKYYEVADVLGIKDSNFSRLLRYELCKEYKEKILKAIESIQERN